jgi:hypothetical protein
MWYFNGNDWIWMNGSPYPNSGGSYGNVGVAAASNQPGARRSSSSTVTSNKFYLFGGLGYGKNGQYGKKILRKF